MLFNCIEDANKLASRITKLRNEKRISEGDYKKMCAEIAKQFYKMQSRNNNIVCKKSKMSGIRKSNLSKMSKI